MIDRDNLDSLWNTVAIVLGTTTFLSQFVANYIDDFNKVIHTAAGLVAFIFVVHRYYVFYQKQKQRK